MEDDIFSIAAHVLLSTLGTIAKNLNIKNRKTLSVIQYVSSAFIASFMGLIIYFLARYMNLDNNLSYAIAGLAGWIGTQTLDAIAIVIKKAAGIDLPIKEGENENEDNG
jgi:hypothetical protein